MKSISLRKAIAAASLTVMMCACGGSGEGSSLSDLSNPTAGDSLLYYYGLVQASHFWQDTTDSLALSATGRQSYLRGLQEGIESFGKDGSYTDGLLAGLEIARNLEHLERDYGVKIDPKVVLESIRYGLSQDSIADEEENNMHFYELLTKLGKEKDAADISKSEQALSKKAKEEGMTKISSLLYSKVLTPGYGKKVRKGDKIAVEVTVSCNGNNIAIPLPDSMTAGTPYGNPVVDEALCTMSEGESTEFLSTAMALFGRKCSRMNLSPSDLITIKITAGRMLHKVLGPEKNTDGSQDTPSAL